MEWETREACVHVSLIALLSCVLCCERITASSPFAPGLTLERHTQNADDWVAFSPSSSKRGTWNWGMH